MPYEIKKFCPATGVGRFDAKLEGGRMRVKMKLHVKSALGEDDQTRFRVQFPNVVKAAWEGQYGLRCSSGPARGDYEPEFAFSFVDDYMQAHFVVNFLPGTGTELVSRDTYYKVGTEHPGHTGFAPTSVNLYNASIEQIDTSGLITGKLADMFPQYIDTYGGHPSGHSVTQLDLIAKMVAAVNTNTRLTVTGYGANWRTARDNVATRLRNAGLRNVVTRKSDKAPWTTSHSRSSNRTNYVKIEAKNGIDARGFRVDTAPLFTYPAAAAHEFGHMLGLQDEYYCLSKQGGDKMSELHFIDGSEQQKWESFAYRGANPAADRGAAGQAAFIDLCYRARVDIPAFGQHTISIMSAGSDFYPWHFVTLWSAAVEATRGVADEGDWSIYKL